MPVSVAPLLVLVSRVPAATVPARVGITRPLCCPAPASDRVAHDADVAVAIVYTHTHPHCGRRDGGRKRAERRPSLAGDAEGGDANALCA